MIFDPDTDSDPDENMAVVSKSFFLRFSGQTVGGNRCAGLAIAIKERHT